MGSLFRPCHTACQTPNHPQVGPWSHVLHMCSADPTAPAKQHNFTSTAQSCEHPTPAGTAREAACDAAPHIGSVLPDSSSATCQLQLVARVICNTGQKVVERQSPAPHQIPITTSTALKIENHCIGAPTPAEAHIQPRGPITRQCGLTGTQHLCLLGSSCNTTT